MIRFISSLIEKEYTSVTEFGAAVWHGRTEATSWEWKFVGLAVASTVVLLLAPGPVEWAYAKGIIFSVLVGALMIGPVMRQIHEPLGKRPHLWHGSLLGVLERVLYTASLMPSPTADKVIPLAAVAVPVWLTLKVATTWSKWSEGRAEYNVFLIGNALSLIYAGTGALWPAWHTNGVWGLAVLSLVFGTCGVLVLGCYHTRRQRLERDSLEVVAEAQGQLEIEVAGTRFEIVVQAREISSRSSSQERQTEEPGLKATAEAAAVASNSSS